MPHITLKQISIFNMVARYQNHTRAATKLHMTQPAVSMQMKQLEESLDIHLFERHGKSITLTREAHELRKYTGDIVQSYRAMMERVDEIKGIEHGQLIISATTTANYFITRILAKFSKLHPKIKISLCVTNRKNILTQLEYNEPDQVIMGEPPKDLDLTSEKFMENSLVFIAPPDHHLCTKKNITLDEVMQEKFVGREQGSGTLEAAAKHLKRFKKEYISSLEVSSNEAIKHAVAAGFGLGIVSKHTIALELKSDYLRMLDVESFPILRHWHLVTRKGKATSPIAEAFRSFLLEEAKHSS